MAYFGVAYSDPLQYLIKGLVILKGWGIGAWRLNGWGPHPHLDESIRKVEAFFLEQVAGYLHSILSSKPFAMVSSKLLNLPSSFNQALIWASIH